MKTILILSLGANLVLLGAVGYLTVGKSPSKETAAVSADQKTADAKTSQPKAGESSVVTERVIQTIDWRNVESEDYRKYIANLRQIGCPEETIRDIIIADVNKLFSQRKREIAGAKKFEFWKTSSNPFLAMMDSDRMEARNQLEKEKRALLKELLGVEPPAEAANMFAGMFEAMLDFLPPEKEGRVMQLLQDAQVKMMKRIGNGGPPDAEDRKEMRKFQKEMEAELAAMLTPQELEDFQLRMSQTAMTMRMQLASFEPNEDEFRKIFSVKKKYDDEFDMFGAADATAEEKEKRKAAKEETDQQIRQILGDDRYADYERAQDWGFRTIYQVTEKNKLPKETANKVYDMKKAAEEEAKNLRNNTTLSAQDRTAALQAIRAETERSMQTVLGDKAYKSYEGQAYWLNSISPKTPTPTPTQ